MSRPAVLAISTLAVIALSTAAGCGGAQQSTNPDGSPAPPATSGAAAPTQDAGHAAAPAAVETFSATLLFADDEGRLQPEMRDLPSAGAQADRARRVVEALLDGPQDSLTAVLPVDAALRALYLDDDGTAYVDFDAGFTRGLSDGSEDALIAASSLAGTLAANFSEIRQVRILVDGSEVPDFGGHLDLSRPIPVQGVSRAESR